MKKKIMILDDNLYTAEALLEDITNDLRLHGIYDIEVIVATNIYKANSIVENTPLGELKCIITDLNMSPRGLSDEEKQKTQGAVLTGWVWVNKYVLKDDRFKKTHIIIYSAFIEELRRNNQYRQLSFKERSRFTLLDKNESMMTALFKEVCKYI